MNHQWIVIIGEQHGYGSFHFQRVVGPFAEYAEAHDWSERHVDPSLLDAMIRGLVSPTPEAGTIGGVGCCDGFDVPAGAV